MDTITSSKTLVKREADEEDRSKVNGESNISAEQQQLFVNIFANCCSSTLSTNFTQSLQEVKKHLYNRDFDKAFGSEQYREVYVLRWSPSRTLCYLTIFQDIQQYLPFVQCCLDDLDAPDRVLVTLSTAGASQTSVESNKQILESPPGLKRSGRMLCLGGGSGAEIVAFAGFLHLHATTARFDESPNQCTTAKSSGLGKSIDLSQASVTAVDIADWSKIVETLYDGITIAPPLSRYASASRGSNKALVSTQDYAVTFEQHDVLNMGLADINRLSKDVHLVTLMFTLNELYATSMAKTTKLLLSLTAQLYSGTLLLVVDSPGSYSTISLDKSSERHAPAQPQKKYPMQWLLDHTLLNDINNTKGEKANQRWEKLVSDESRWFRLPEGLRYPLDLENMRYQIHLYRRL